MVSTFCPRMVQILFYVIQLGVLWTQQDGACDRQVILHHPVFSVGGYKTKTEDLRPKNEKQGATRFAVFNKSDQGLHFVQNPTKSTKRRPLQNRLENTSKWLEHDYRPKQKQETTRFAVINEFDQDLRFVHNPAKSTKRRRAFLKLLEISSKQYSPTNERRAFIDDNLFFSLAEVGGGGGG